MSHIRLLADRINSVEGLNNVWEAALTFLPSLDLTKVVFLDLSQPTTPLIRSNAGQAWDVGYTASVKSGDDPFAANCLSHVSPMLTGIGHFENHSYLDDNAKALIAQGSEALDINTGMSVTIRPDAMGAGIGWNLMTGHSASEFAEMREHYEADWRAWCQLAYAGLSYQDEHIIQTTLTTREQDCLAYIADGLRTADVAHRLGIAETTAEMHLRKARIRLGAKTRDQAVAMAVRKGWI